MMSSKPAVELSALAPVPTGMAPVGELKHPVRCLLCDIYGTLLISGSGDIGTSRQRSTPHAKLEKLLAKYDIDKSVAQLLGMLHDAIEARRAQARSDGVAFPEINIDVIWAQILNWPTAEKSRPFAWEFEMIVNPVWPMPGLTELLSTCRENSILLGIISNAQFFTLSLFDRLLNTKATDLGFDRELCFLSYQHGIAKPSPALFQMASSRLKRMGISASQTAFIGNDMRNDILPSSRMGFQTVLFAGDARSLRMRSGDPLCHGLRPDLTVTQLKQLTAQLHPDPPGP